MDGGCVYDVTEGAPVYQRKEKATPDEKDSYEIVRHKTDYKYAQNMLFPRMYSDAHAPVSYTHLDVYKRQPYGIDCIPDKPNTNKRPVSLKHKPHIPYVCLLYTSGA